MCKSVKCSPHLWITIGNKKLQGLCNTAAGLRAYLWELYINPERIQTIAHMIKTGHLGNVSSSSEAPLPGSTLDAHTATESPISVTTDDTTPAAKGSGLHLELESFGGFKICLNQRKNDDPDWSAFITGDRLTLNYLDSRAHLRGRVCEAFRNPLASEIETGCQLVNGMFPISSAPTEHVDIIFNADAGSRFSRDCSKGFKSEGTAMSLDLSSLRMRLDRRTFFMLQDALIGPWVRSAGCIIKENVLYTTEMTSRISKLLLNMEGVTNWSETGEATSRGTCTQLLAEDFYNKATISRYGIRGRSEYDVGLRNEMIIPRCELFGPSRLPSGRYGEDNAKLPFTKQSLQPMVTPLHKPSAASPPQVKLTKTFRISSYPRLMTTGYTAEAAWEYSMEFEVNRCKIYDDLTALKWFAGFINSDDIDYAELKPLNPAKAHPYHAYGK